MKRKTADTLEDILIVCGIPFVFLLTCLVCGSMWLYDKIIGIFKK